MENILLEKKILREKMRSMLRDFCSDKNERTFASKAVCDIFLSSELYKNAPLVCAFCSLPNEIETMPIIECALRDGKKVALPRVAGVSRIENPSSLEMDFFLLDGARPVADQLSVGAYGIREPRADLEKLAVTDVCRDTVFLVPGLAFDRSGARLGKGKAYYDKYFARVANAQRVANGQCVANGQHVANVLRVSDASHLADAQQPADAQRVGFCFPFQLLRNVPHEPHDIHMTHIVSDKIISCR